MAFLHLEFRQFLKNREFRLSQQNLEAWGQFIVLACFVCLKWFVQ